MDPKRLLERLRAGHVQNVRFTDLLDLAKGLGFELDRVRGSHHILRHPAIRRSMNLQEDNRQAKPYQIRQLLDLGKRYNLSLED